MCRYIFEAINALPATGKTHSSIANHIKENSDKTLLMVMPHKKTLEEKVKLAFQLVSEDTSFERYNRKIRAVHSDNTTGNIPAAIIEALNDDEVGILFITHEGFLKVAQDVAELSQTKKIFTDVFIDEELAALKDFKLGIRLNRWKNDILPFIDISNVVPEQLGNISDNGKKDSDSLLHIRLKDSYKTDDSISSELKEFFKYLENPNYNMYINKMTYLQVVADIDEGVDEYTSQHTLLATALLDPKTYSPLQPTFMAAFFKDTIFYHIMQKQGVEFRFREPAYIKARDNKDRKVTIKYFLPEKLSTDSTKQTQWSKALADKYSNGIRNLDKIQNAIQEDSPDTPLYYIINKSHETGDVWQGVHTIAGKFEGTDRFKSYPTSVFLAAYNSTPQAIKMHNSLGVDPTKVNTARNLIKMGQFQRGVIRQLDPTHSDWNTPYTCYVPTKESAEFLVSNNFSKYQNVSIEFLPVPDLIFSTEVSSIKKEQVAQIKMRRSIQEAYAEYFDGALDGDTINILMKIVCKAKEKGLKLSYKTAFKMASGSTERIRVRPDLMVYYVQMIDVLPNKNSQVA